MYIVSRKKWDMLFDETDYAYFYDADDMEDFLENNKKFVEREDMEHPYDLHDVLVDLDKKSKSGNGMDIVDAYGEYIRKYVYYLDETKTKYRFGYINNIYFKQLLKSEKDWHDGRFTSNTLEIGNMIEGGCMAFQFEDYKGKEIDQNIISDFTGKIVKLTKLSPIAEIKSRAREYVYFVESTKDGCIKIGYTKNIDNRFRSLQTSVPFPLKLLHYVNGSVANERALHEKFKKYRLSGEWFEGSEELRSYINGLIDKKNKSKIK